MEILILLFPIQGQPGLKREEQTGMLCPTERLPSLTINLQKGRSEDELQEGKGRRRKVATLGAVRVHTK